MQCDCALCMGNAVFSWWRSTTLASSLSIRALMNHYVSILSIWCALIRAHRFYRWKICLVNIMIACNSHWKCTCTSSVKIMLFHEAGKRQQTNNLLGNWLTVNCRELFRLEKLWKLIRRSVSTLRWDLNTTASGSGHKENCEKVHWCTLILEIGRVLPH